MTHTGTMDLGGKARTRQGGGRWLTTMLALAVVVATISAIWFASRAGVVGGTATKPAVDRSFDQIEAQRGAIALSTDRNADLNRILDGAHAKPFVATMPSDIASARRGYAVEVQPIVAVRLPALVLPDNVSTVRRGYAAAAEAAVNLPIRRRPHSGAITPSSSTSSTFHPGKAADDLVFAATLPDNLSVRRGYAAVAATLPNVLWTWRSHTTGAAMLPDNLSARRGYTVEIAGSSFSATSGTFHLGR
jgi:hypothetical protein